jgi:hypothetical protein
MKAISGFKKGDSFSHCKIAIQGRVRGPVSKGENEGRGADAFGGIGIYTKSTQ